MLLSVFTFLKCPLLFCKTLSNTKVVVEYVRTGEGKMTCELVSMVTESLLLPS